ncbi:hypothetical protein [Pyrococcus yayanosii]|uniref:Uncharacterized protein n=1 Tax=Pyrococcus yayanosii (strain CH1 / JCM 16557) TaxID=529709 RepID=F8AHD9_PYRYC|nr:hypothetical protein [Pyrococcus yayanosii]AEH24136.1 hypothetical protein PYCH_04460 [Pyrococcus yayanosii CH1]
MVVEEVLASVSSIPDPYLRIVTYGRIGVSLAKSKDPRYEKAFRLALSELARIDDPYILLRSLLALAYSTSLAGFKSAKKAFREVMESSKVLPKPLRDSLRIEAVKYLLALGEVEEALFYTLEIEDKKARNETLLAVLKRALRELSGDKMNRLYRRRKIQLILEHVTDEPYRSMAIVETIKAFLSVGEYEKAIHLVETIGNRHWLKQALREILVHLRRSRVGKEYAEKLIILSLNIAKRLGEDIRDDMAFIFAAYGYPEYSIQLLRGSPKWEERLKEILEMLFKRDMTLLIDYVSALPEDMLPALKHLMNIILDEPLGEYKPVVDALVQKEPPQDILTKATAYYLKVGALPDAVKVISKITDERLRSLALGWLAHYLIKVGRISEAVDVVLQIRDRNLAARLASEILVRVVEEREKDGIAEPTKEWRKEREA